jgi:vacuolar protein sorting-associated protein 11
MTDLIQQVNITCVATGSDNIFFGSADGIVRILSQAFKTIRTFKAYETASITHMKQVQGTSLLVTIAEDLSNEPLLKVWALDKLEKKSGSPRCQCTLSIHNGRKQFPVS